MSNTPRNVNNIDRYGITVGQRYLRADGAPCGVDVIGLDRERDDVIVRHDDGHEQAIDAWKLAVVRYYLDCVSKPSESEK